MSLKIDDDARESAPRGFEAEVEGLTLPARFAAARGAGVPAEAGLIGLFSCGIHNCQVVDSTASAAKRTLVFCASAALVASSSSSSSLSC